MKSAFSSTLKEKQTPPKSKSKSKSSSSRNRKNSDPMTSFNLTSISKSSFTKLLALLLGIVALIIIYAIAQTNSNYNLFLWDFNNLEWSKAWLVTTVVDFYGATIPLIGIVFQTEPFLHACIWTCGFCLLGSPIHLSYAIYRLLTSGTLELKGSAERVAYTGLA